MCRMTHYSTDGDSSTTPHPPSPSHSLCSPCGETGWLQAGVGQQSPRVGTQHFTFIPYIQYTYIYNILWCVCVCVCVCECWIWGEREGIIGLCGLDLTLSTTRGFHIQFSSRAKLFGSTTSEHGGRGECHWLKGLKYNIIYTYSNHIIIETFFDALLKVQPV